MLPPHLLTHLAHVGGPAHALAWLLAAHTPASPEPGVRWIAPPGCPDRAALLAAVARRLGRPLTDAEAAIDARVVGDAHHGYTLHLTLVTGARGETREVQDPSCAALTDAAALRVVAALESAPPLVPPAPDDAPVTAPESAPEATPAVGAPTVVVVPAPVPPIPALPTPPPPALKDRKLGGVLRLHGGAEYGALPGPTGAVGLALGLLWPRLRVELQGAVLAPRTTTGAPPPVSAGLYAGAVHGCARLGRGAIEAPMCVGVELGAMRGETSGVPGAQPRAAFWLAAVLAPGLAWHISPRISAWASLQLVLAPVYPKFQLASGTRTRTIFDPGVASGRLLLGVEFRIRDHW